jgi:hypothetical protein
MALDKAALAEIERLYRADTQTLVQIGARYGLEPTAISRLARTHGWPMRYERMGRKPRHVIPSTPKVRAMLALRLCDVIKLKLEQMEADMASGELSSQDYERDAKAVAAMIGSVDRTHTTDPDAKKTPKPQSAEPAAVSDVERIHREIIERFERIQRRRNAAGGSG